MINEEYKKEFLKELCRKVLVAINYAEDTLLEKHPHVNKRGVVKCAINAVVEQHFKLTSDEAKELLQELKKSV